MGLSNDLSCEAGSFSCCRRRNTPTDVFNQRFEALFPCAGALGSVVCFTPALFVLVYLCANVGPRGLLPATLPALFSASLSPALSVYLCANVGQQGLPVVLPHSASLGPATATRVLSTRVPVSALPTSLDEFLFFISLVWDFVAVRFSVSCDCARRRSVSTYAAILVLSPKFVILNH